MSSKIRIAIYSGEIPSTTFIEQLVSVIAEEHEVLLFGNQKMKVSYTSSNIKVKGTARNRWHKIWSGIRTIILLFLKNKEDYALLKELIHLRANSFKKRIILWNKYGKVVLEKPDIFHLQWAKVIKEWYFLRDLFGIKIVLSLRGAHLNYSPLADHQLARDYKDMFPKLDGFHSVSEALAIEALKYNADRDKIKVVYTAFNKPSDLNVKSIYETKKVLKLVSVGRFHWKKGYQYAFEALARLKWQGVKFKYHLIAGVATEEVLFRLHDLDIEKEVIIHPRMEQSEMYKLMLEADLLLLPSVEEGIANVVVEAMGIGLPVITSDCCGMTEAVEHRISGLVFKNRSIDDLVEQLNVFRSMNNTQRKTMAQNAVKKVEVQFSQENYRTGMVDLYRSVL